MRAIAPDPGLQIDDGWEAKARQRKRLLAGGDELDGFPGAQRQQRRIGLHTEAQFGAKTTAQFHRDHPKARHGPSDHRGQRGPDLIGRLRRGPDVDAPGGIDVGDAGHGFEIALVDALRAKGVFKDVVGLGKGRVDIAAVRLQDGADIAPHVRLIALIGGQVCMHQRGIGPQRGDGIGDGWQILIRHVDQVERFQGRDLVHRRHGRHGLPDIAHFVEGKNAFILDGAVAKAHIRDIAPGDARPAPRAGAAPARYRCAECGHAVWGR